MIIAQLSWLANLNTAFWLIVFLGLFFWLFRYFFHKEKHSALLKASATVFSIFIVLGLTSSGYTTIRGMYVESIYLIFIGLVAVVTFWNKRKNLLLQFFFYGLLLTYWTSIALEFSDEPRYVLLFLLPSLIPALLLYKLKKIWLLFLPWVIFYIEGLFFGSHERNLVYFVREFILLPYTAFAVYSISVLFMDLYITYLCTH
jgi:hypothetical protein